MDRTKRADIKPGTHTVIVRKKDQLSGELTYISSQVTRNILTDRP
jgi:uncharacterized protein YwbE